MNIKEAKQEIINAVRAYTTRDETGSLVIEPARQRPLLLIGPPGIGKTAIMEQAASELGINLVSYTITHHTRQSAIGLPYIAHRKYGEKEYSVTEYTMSEIIASVYDQIEASGVSEGILFLDEINCVSETLAPTMLQFLQYKTFGTHQVPEGFVIVTAGNPPQYNKSVRDFDIVTLDRVRRIVVEEDFPVWKEYAYRAGVHGSIMAYLEIHRQNFYSIRTEVDDRYFVTARGWEDLSKMISLYEKSGMQVTENLVQQYLQDEKIAEDFAVYYELYNKYRTVYGTAEILEGVYPEDSALLKNAPFDEKLSLIGLLVDSLDQEFSDCIQQRSVQEMLLPILRQVRDDMKTGSPLGEVLGSLLQRHENGLEARNRAHMISREELRRGRLVTLALKDLEKAALLEQSGNPAQDYGMVKSWFDKREKHRADAGAAADAHLTHCFEYMARTYGEGQEMIIFLSELTAGYYSLEFIKDWQNEAYYRYNKLLLLQERQDTLRREVLELV